MPRRPRNIRRVDHHHFHGWIASLKRQGRRYERYFKDSPDRASSLARALDWRDQMLARLPPPRKFKRSYVLNTTGVVGVTVSRERTRSGRVFRRYRAACYDETGRERRRSFSIARYGAAKARALAITARKDAIEAALRPPGRVGAARRHSRRRRD